jgi:hypothetical protein
MGESDILGEANLSKKMVSAMEIWYLIIDDIADIYKQNKRIVSDGQDGKFKLRK